MAVGAFCGVVPFLLRKKIFRIQRKKTKMHSSSCEVEGHIAAVIELKKKISTFRSLLDLAPCAGSVSVTELLLRTLRDLRQLYPAIRPEISIPEAKDASMQEVLKFFCRALSSLGEMWSAETFVYRERYDSYNELGRTELEQIALEMVADMIKLASEWRTGATGEDKGIRDCVHRAGGKALRESHSDEIVCSPKTPTSVVPEAWRVLNRINKTSHFPPLILPLTVKAIKKLNLLDVKLFSIHILPRVGDADPKNFERPSENGMQGRLKFGEKQHLMITDMKEINRDCERVEKADEGNGQEDEPSIDYPKFRRTVSERVTGQDSHEEVAVEHIPPPSIPNLPAPVMPPALPPPPTGLSPNIQPPPSKSKDLEPPSIPSLPAPVMPPALPPPPPRLPPNIQPPPQKPKDLELLTPHQTSGETVPAPPPILPSPMAPRNGAEPLAPTPNDAKKVVTVPSPPTVKPVANGAAPPPPPGFGGAKNFRQMKAASKLKRSSQMGNLYRLLKGKIEGTSLDGRLTEKKSKVGATSGGNQGMADALAEMTKRSAYFQQIEADVKNHEKSIKEVEATISSFQTSNMAELMKFHKYVELQLEKLTDETQVLARFEEFPTKKLESLRMAAALHSKLNSIVSTLQNWPLVSSARQLLDKAENYFSKIKGEIETLDRTKDEEANKFQAHKIKFDFGIIVRIKELMVDLSSSCMELALTERRDAIAKGSGGFTCDRRNNKPEKILWRSFQLAFRVYTFAGGHDDRADELTRALADEIETDTIL